MDHDATVRALLMMLADVDAMRESAERVEIQVRALAGRFGLVGVADPTEIADSDDDAIEEVRNSAVILDFQRRRE